MPVQLGVAHDHSFDQPLGLLSDCHRRIEHFLDILLKVTELARGGPLDAQQRQALEAALRYFAVAAPRHTEDEESSLFPRMRRTDDPQVADALEKVAALEADHRAAETGHREVDDLGRRWLEGGRLSQDEVSRLATVLGELREAYRRHIAFEDTELFPLAGRVLDANALSEIGREMAQRRGLGGADGER